MQASKDNIKVDNTVIFKCDEYRRGDIQEFDGNVQRVDDKGIDVIYLSGHKSRNDFIPYSDVLAKLDKRKPYVKLTNAPYSGHFIEYDYRD